MVKAQLEMATAELEQLRATDQRRVAELVAAKENAKVCALLSLFSDICIEVALLH